MADSRHALDQGGDQSVYDQCFRQAMESISSNKKFLKQLLRVNRELCTANMVQQFYPETPEPQTIAASKTPLTVLNFCLLVLEMTVRLAGFHL